MSNKYSSLIVTLKRTVPLVFVLLLLAGSIVQPAAAQGQPPALDSSLSPETTVSNDGLVFSAQDVLGDGLGKLPDFQETFPGIGDTGDPTLTADEEPLPGIDGVFPSSIIGPDGRTRVYGTTSFPYRAIAFLRVTWPNGSSGTCTGWFIGRRTVATAGHCVYDSGSGGWAASITAYPGRNGGSIPYGSSTAHRLFSVVGWTRDRSKDYDYGALQLHSALGDTVGWFGFRWQSGSTFSGSYTITGYPGDKTYGTMWKMTDNPGIRRVWTYRLFYQIDTYAGQSGSAVYHYYSSSCSTCSVAIHTYGVGGDPYGQYNSGTRITQSVFNNLVSWKYYQYP